jgi:hyperosmotically inducible periplasmic protein
VLRRTAIAAVVAVLVASTWGCREPAGPTDAEIRSEIATNLNANNITGIQVSVVNGVATLTGSADQATADRAAEIAHAAKGIQSVDNKISVSGGAGTGPTTGPPPPVDPNNNDSILAAMINQRLAADPALAGSNIAFPAVAAGVATLVGTVPSDAAKAAAEKTTRAVSGVTNVVNQLQVVTPPVAEPPVPDEQIQAAVEQLLDDKFPDLVVFVQVKNGVVVLSGALPDRGLIVQITNAVRQVKGVKSVDTSRFTIQGGESGDKKLGAPANKN